MGRYGLESDYRVNLHHDELDDEAYGLFYVYSQRT